MVWCDIFHFNTSLIMHPMIYLSGWILYLAEQNAVMFYFLYLAEQNDMNIIYFQNFIYVQL